MHLRVALITRMTNLIATLMSHNLHCADPGSDIEHCIEYRAAGHGVTKSQRHCSSLSSRCWPGYKPATHQHRNCKGNNEKNWIDIDTFFLLVVCLPELYFLKFSVLLVTQAIISLHRKTSVPKFSLEDHNSQKPRFDRRTWNHFRGLLEAPFSQTRWTSIIFWGTGRAAVLILICTSWHVLGKSGTCQNTKKTKTDIHANY